MNTEGVEGVMSFLKSEMDTPQILSNLTIEQEKRNNIRVGRALVRLMFDKSKEWGIEPSKKDAIFQITYGNVEKSLSRARGGFFALLISKAFGSKEIITKSEGRKTEEADRSRGWFR